MNEESTDIKPDKQEENKPKRDERGRLLPGNTANLKGRPKGMTIKEQIRKIFEENPTRFNELVDRLIEQYPALVWQMLEGKPPQDLNLGNQDLPFIIKIIQDDGNKPEPSG